MNNSITKLSPLGDLSSALSPLDVCLVLFLSFFLSLLIAFVYRSTHKGISYSQSYVQTLVIMGTVVAFIMLIIGSNIARAFALVGALSIVRFRNAMKETRDIGFIFMSMAVGMGVGTRFYLLAILASVVLCSFVLAMHHLNLFAKDVRERMLRIQLPVGLDYDTAFNELFAKELEEFRLISLETTRAGVLQEVVYSVTLRKNTQPGELLNAIRSLNGNHKVSLILGQQELDL